MQAILRKRTTRVHSHLTGARKLQWQQALRGWELPPTTKLVGYTLSTYANGDGTEARPSQATLANDCGLKRRAMWEHLRALREAEVIERVSSGSNLGHVNAADVYRLTIPSDLGALVRRPVDID